MLSDSDAALPVYPSSELPFLATGFSVAEIDLLLQSEARFRALAQATGQIYWVADAEGRLTDSSSWASFTGQTNQEARGDGWVAAVHPDDREQVLAAWASAVTTRQPYCHEHRVRRKDGHYRLMLARAYPALHADRTVSEWVGVDTDITLLQELRAEVQTSQEEFQATFEQAAAGMVHVRPDGRILRANQKFCEILGYTQEELLNRTFQELTYPPDLAANLALLEHLLAGTIPTYTLEKRYLRKDGSLVWVTLTASLKHDQIGKPQYCIAVVEDISARKAVEEALKQVQAELCERVQELETIFASMSDGLIVFGTDGKMLHINPAYASLVGWPADSSFYDLSWEERQQILQIRDSRGELIPFEQLPLGQVLRGENIAEEHILRHRDGHDVYVSMRGAPLTDASGRVIGAVLVHHDITERRQLERQALDLANQLEAMFVAIEDGVAIYDLSGRVMRANPAYYTLLRVQPRHEQYSMTLAERNQLSRVSDEQGQPFSEQRLVLEEILHGKSAGSRGVDLFIHTQDGRDLEVNVTGGPLKNSAGTVVGAVVVYHDVTERRQIEKQTQETLSALLHMDELLVQQPLKREEQVSSLMGRRMAELACSLLGCAAAALLKLTPDTLAMQVLATVGYTQEKEEHLLPIIAGWSYSPGDLGYIRRLMDGEVLVLEVTESPYRQLARIFDVSQVIVAPMLLGGRLIGMVVFHPDKATHMFSPQQIALAGATAQLVGLVVERERLQHEREEAHTRAQTLQESNSQMETFLGMVSHELRTPLASMMWSLQSINLRLDDARFEAPAAESSLQNLLTSLQELLAPAELQIAQLEQMITDLLDDVRIKQDKLELRLRPLDLRTIIQKVVDEQRKLMPDRAINVQMPGDQAILVQADAGRIRQALINYLTNALIYSPKAMPVFVSAERKKGQAWVWVRDFGPGIPQAEQERVWERFYRVSVNSELNAPAEGLGLGLYVTKMLIERHQGKVGLTSMPGEGSTFWFRLPLTQQQRRAS